MATRHTRTQRLPPDTELPNAADRYATAQPDTSGLTRAEVRASVDQARRDGTLVVSDITGRPFYGVSNRIAGRGTGSGSGSGSE